VVGLETTAREKSSFFSATPSEGRTLLIGILAPKDPESQFYGLFVQNRGKQTILIIRKPTAQVVPSRELET